MSWTQAAADEIAELLAAQNALNASPRPWAAEVERAFELLAARAETLMELAPAALDSIEGDLEAL
jgi:hypothetical protein